MLLSIVTYTQVETFYKRELFYRTYAQDMKDRQEKENKKAKKLFLKKRREAEIHAYKGLERKNPPLKKDQELINTLRAGGREKFEKAMLSLMFYHYGDLHFIKNLKSSLESIAQQLMQKAKKTDFLSKTKIESELNTLHFSSDASTIEEKEWEEVFSLLLKGKLCKKNGFIPLRNWLGYDEDNTLYIRLNKHTKRILKEL